MKKLLLMAIFVSLTNSLMGQEVIVKEKVKFLALGDSYTIGESVPQSARWPVQVIDSIRKRGLQTYDAKIIATTGWRTDNLKNAIDAANLTSDYNLVSLLIGVNNQYQGYTAESYAPEFEGLLTKAIELAGGIKTNVFVVSIPDYGYTPFGKSIQPKISAAIDQFNAVNQSIAQKMGVKYFNITSISRRGLSEPDLVANDGLHPSSKMYTEWAELILNGITLKKSNDSGSGNDPGEVTGADDERLGLNVYPNPFKNEIILEHLLYLEQPVVIELIDSRGVIAMYKSIHHIDRIALDTSSFTPGIYHYKIGNITGKVVKK
ncbi:GDSL-type esterase/lipase family protein [Pseudochryseolinea flava]|uniref:Lysophospholipase n=1 Tax=Pseudochryseolinea flava TaxID=2059302 RepID=A0A364XVI8_9BACT|nr:GDSL-type esterase/lipase family protein [Pseudochryseolinea flava]RAV97966.1 hypothetical protein DQQ10_26205 [Pseudochryseolinea flava]